MAYHSLSKFAAICRQHSVCFCVDFSYEHSYAVIKGKKGELFASPIYRALADSPIAAYDGCEGKGIYYQLESLT